MKILLIGFSKLRYMPYLSFHLQNLDCEKHDVHVLYWNKDGKDDIPPPQPVTLHEFRLLQDDNGSRFFKIGHFLKIRRFTRKLLRRERFDFIIIFSSVPAVLLSDVLRRYKGRYIFDYRDAGYERFGFFSRAVARLVEDSCLTFVSSDAFRELLPKSDKIHTTHNLLPDLLCRRGDNAARTDPLVVSFWGFLRHPATNFALLDALGGDPRFVLRYYGKPCALTEQLKARAEKKGYRNVCFSGEYEPFDRVTFAADTALVDNLYDNDSTRYAVGNRFYDALIFYLPMICRPGSYMAELAEKYGVGVAADPEDAGFADAIYNYYRSLDREVFRRNCDALLDAIRSEYDAAAALLRDL